MPGQSGRSGWVSDTPATVSVRALGGLAVTMTPPLPLTERPLLPAGELLRSLHLGGTAITGTCFPTDVRAGSGLTRRRSALGSATGRTTSRASLSSRRPRNTAWRSRPAPDQAV